jgi:hypothetical protein
MTTCFKLADVDVARMPPGSEITRLFLAAKAAGEIDCPRENVLLFHCLEPDVIHFNTTRVIHRQGTHGAELSAAEVEGRRQVRQLFHFLRAKVSGFENARIHSSMRVMPSACTVGQAAGLGAALAAQRRVNPAELDGGDVRRRLAELGAYL